MKIWYKYDNKIVFILHKNNFKIMIILADMVSLMSNYDIFYNGQIIWDLLEDSVWY